MTNWLTDCLIQCLIVTQWKAYCVPLLSADLHTDRQQYWLVKAKQDKGNTLLNKLYFFTWQCYRAKKKPRSFSLVGWEWKQMVFSFCEFFKSHKFQLDRTQMKCHELWWPTQQRLRPVKMTSYFSSQSGQGRLHFISVLWLERLGDTGSQTLEDSRNKTNKTITLTLV